MKKELKLYNTLSRTKEIFIPIEPDIVKIYTCGPTVYNYAHIGNLRSYIFPDILKKLLKFLGYNVKHIINITDVGHLTSDSDSGDDKVEKEAMKQGKSAWEISRFFANAFIEDIKLLNIELPYKFTYATDYINEQIKMVKILEEKGYTYKTEDGIYFDTSKFSEYGKLARLDLEGLEEGIRVDIKDKKNKTDFALWKFTPKKQKRQMEWESPWGKGFPGWHIECSAMIFAELGSHIDIHTGGTDHIPVHHTNEIAQAECTSGEKFVNYWLHGAFLVLDKNQRMGKSEGNFIGLRELVKQNFLPMSFRYLALNTHYRHFLTFSLDILKSTQNAYLNLKKLIKSEFDREVETDVSEVSIFDKLILDALLDDLNTPKAIGLIWEMLQDKNINKNDKINIIRKYDNILSLNLLDFSDLEKKEIKIPDEVIQLAQKRWNEKLNKNFEEADNIRKVIFEKGFEIRDFKDKYEIYPIKTYKV
ncbi:MAG: cysteine--tRNA ligase [Candidatus Sericytochromatia bacterium]|nr:MAG: cysteine--tRNA ligase [Candidatus Sericytochromatia bacterium]